MFVLYTCDLFSWEFLINTGTLENFQLPISIHYKGPNAHEHLPESLGDVKRSRNTSNKGADLMRKRKVQENYHGED